MKKLSNHEIAVQIAHRVDHKDLPDPVVRFLVKCAVSDLGDGAFGHHDSDRVEVVLNKIDCGVSRYRQLAKAEELSFGRDGGSPDLTPNIGDYRIL